MSHSDSYVSIGFCLKTLVHYGPTRFRVEYTYSPLATSVNGAHDALNPANYAVRGPVGLSVVSVSPVPDSARLYDIYVNATIAGGDWEVSVSNVETSAGNPIEEPSHLSVLVTKFSVPASLSNGAVSDTAESVLRKHLNPIFVGKPVWEALVTALATGDRIVWDNNAKARDQLFRSAASGTYLTKRMAEYGVDRPKEMGISDERFRALGIKKTALQQTIHSILSVLEVFYGADSVRASAVTALQEPYRILDGDLLKLEIDGEPEISILFTGRDFSIASKASAIEVAAAITRGLELAGSQAYAVAWTDPADGQQKVKIYSSSLGLKSSLKITGGRVQTALQFPTKILNAPVGATFSVTAPSTGILRFSTTDDSFDLQDLQVGDCANIYGPFHAENQGSHEILGVSVSGNPTFVQSFDVAHVGTPEIVTVADEDDLILFRPAKNGIQSGAQTVVVSQSSPGTVDISIPATSVAVERRLGWGTYLPSESPLKVLSAIKMPNGEITLETSTPHNLSGGLIQIQGAAPSMSEPGTASGGPGYTSSSPISFWSELGGYISQSTLALSLSSGKVFTYSRNAGAFEAIEITGKAGTPDGGIRYQYSSYYSNPPVDFGEHCAGAQLDDSTLVLVGDEEGLGSVFLYDLAQDQWTELGGLLAAPLRHHTVNRFGSGKIAIIGGIEGYSGSDSDLCEVYDPVDDSVTSFDLKSYRAKHATVELDSGDLLVMGGTSFGNVLPECEIVNESGSTLIAKMNYRREAHAAVKLPNGDVLVVGGRGAVAGDFTKPEAPLRSCEIWSRSTGRWNPAGRLAFARHGANAVYNPATNQVVVCGGQGLNGPVTQAEIYSVDSGLWSIGPKMANANMISDACLIDGEAIYSVGDGGFGEILISNSTGFASGQLNGEYRIQGVTDTTITIQGPPGYTEVEPDRVEVYPIQAQSQVFSGPFVFSPDGGVLLTGTTTNTTSALDKGHKYISVEVADASQFPDEPGWIVLGFGTKHQLDPIRYIGKSSETALLLDAKGAFEVQIPIGTTVDLVSGRDVFQPEKKPNCLYATGSASGRNEAVRAVDDILAAGLTANVTVVYPGDVGLGGEGRPASGQTKLSDKVAVFGGDSLEEELEKARQS